VGTEQWKIDMTVTEQADSVHGTALLTSVPARIHEGYTVTGTAGDSLRLLLRPIEDADIHIVTGIGANRLDGRMWMNQFTDQAHPITFDRQPTP
jgi:hypothetical protein